MQNLHQHTASYLNILAIAMYILGLCDKRISPIMTMLLIMIARIVPWKHKIYQNISKHSSLYCSLYGIQCLYITNLRIKLLILTF